MNYDVDGGGLGFLHSSTDGIHTFDNQIHPVWEHIVYSYFGGVGLGEAASQSSSSYTKRGKCEKIN